MREERELSAQLAFRLCFLNLDDQSEIKHAVKFRPAVSSACAQNAPPTKADPTTTASVFRELHSHSLSYVGGFQL